VNKVVFYALTSPSLKAPLHLADNVVCCSLDYVEARIPAIKQQPQEVFNQIYEFLFTLRANSIFKIIFCYNWNWMLEDFEK
jgi:hypothetical protein